MGMWSRLRPSDSSLGSTTEETRIEAEEARIEARASAIATKSTTPDVEAVASSLTRQGEMNHFSEMLIYSFTQRKA